MLFLDFHDTVLDMENMNKILHQCICDMLLLALYSTFCWGRINVETVEPLASIKYLFVCHSICHKLCYS